ncbi:hypothetical protein MNBD_ALPHA05-236, partial [hydrothermal vent metagenome]
KGEVKSEEGARLYVANFVNWGPNPN